MSKHALPRSLRIVRLARCSGGIFGRKPCQLCGKLGDYQGWGGAIAAHGGICGSIFIPQDHAHDLEAKIAVRRGGTHRHFCRACSALVDVPEQPSRAEPMAPTLCETCSADASLEWVLPLLHRVRYIEHHAPTDEDLARMEGWSRLVVSELERIDPRFNVDR